MRWIILLFLFLFARMVSAQVVISEIMYDPKGADTGHEWIEVWNSGGSAVDLLKSKFVEGGSSHGLTTEKGDGTLAPNAYAIIADNAGIFLSDHSGFLGIVLDSSFSLKNGGETIAFKMPDGTVSDTVVYASDMGATEDGKSLQKMGGTWKGGVPTPGVGVSADTFVAGSNISSSNSSANTFVNTSVANTSTFPVEPQIIADAGASTRTVVTGAPVTFSGKVFGLKKEPIENARMVWSFGDGGSSEGQSVLHTYYYPGEYVVVLDASSGYYSASDRVRVTVVKPELILRTGGDALRSFVAIENLGSDEIDLSLWLVGVGNSAFVLPKNTLVGARKTLTLPSEVTRLSTPDGSVAELRYPNGTAVISLKEKPMILKETSVQKDVSVMTQSSLPVVSVQKVPPRLKGDTQFAAALEPLSDVVEIGATSVQPKKESLLVWYIAVAFLGVFALVGLRFGRGQKKSDDISAEDFEITEEK